MESVFYGVMFVLGVIFGSFLACQAWRLHYYDTKKKKLGKRSVCLSCREQLRWYDNIPIFSWLFLRGKCRYCGKKIGLMEILAEVLMGLAFFGIATTIDLDANVMTWMIFGVTLLLILSLGFLAIYDGKWGELPDFMLIISAIIAVGLFGLKVFNNGGLSIGGIWNTVGAVLILGGLYLILYLVSRGKWVGNGDWILGAIIGLVLGESWLALIVLFLANFIGTLVMYPAVKKRKDSKIYFGPFLVVAFVITLVFSGFFNSLIF